MKKILVTGGLGFIGSHTAVALQQAGLEVVIIDDLSNSLEATLDGIRAITGRRPVFEQFDLRDKPRVEDFFARHEDTHGYSISRGIPRLRQAICNWYQTRYNVDLDPDSGAIVTLGSKEGLAHLALAVIERGDVVLAPNPAYPIHSFGFIIAGADVRHVPIGPDIDFFEELQKAIRDCWPKPKLLLINFPGNPTTQCVELEFFSRVIEIAREHRLWVVQDLAHADIVFDGYRTPSIRVWLNNNVLSVATNASRNGTGDRAGGSALSEWGGVGGWVRHALLRNQVELAKAEERISKRKAKQL